jgi:2-polyprenyl-3-methyl-5-hydroxy-6-metoxy-1,4-benzoquinol methylase
MSHLNPICRFCRSLRAKRVGDQVAGAPEAAVYQCEDCSLVYLFPIMSESEEIDFYRTEFETYMRGRAGMNWKSPEAHFRSFQSEGERRLPLIRPHLRAEDEVLEIGSSTGYFLDDLRGQVKSVTGVEPSEAYREYANAAGIRTWASLAELKGRRFDALMLYYVLEHLRDPVDYLRGLQPYLRSEGRVFIEVPNVDDALLRLYPIPAFGPFYWQKAHYHYFSRGTMQAVLERAGFVVRLIPVQRYDLSNHMTWMATGKPGGTGRYRGVFSDGLEASYADALKSQWLCDTVFAVATLPPAS